MWLVGHYFRVLGSRPETLVIVLALLISAVMWLIMDLDQPAKGAIRASQQSLIDLHDELSRRPPG